jgi:DNA-binding NarL/FixJ family response regulator
MLPGVKSERNNAEPEPHRMISVFVLSANQMIRAGIRMIFQNQRNLVLVGEGGSAGKAVQMAAVEHPNIILIDVDVPGIEVDRLIRDFQKAAEDSLVIILSDLADEELTRKALCTGAAGVILKIQPPSMLIALIESLCSPETRIERPLNNSTAMALPLAVQSHKHEPEIQKINSLTPREREIISLIGKGLRNKDIADRLCISDTTVRHHLTSIFAKLEVSDRQKLLILAHQHGIIDLAVSSEVTG